MAPKKLRPIRVEGNIAYVPLTQGYEAVIDAADVPLVDGRCWRALVCRRKDRSIWNVYAIRSECVDGRYQTLLIHREIVGTGQGSETDHADGNGLNNRRSNLRDATRSENGRNQRISTANTSGFKGVCWDKRRGKWAARIKTDQKTRHLGYFADAAVASMAYAAASAEAHGDFGRVA